MKNLVFLLLLPCVLCRSPETIFKQYDVDEDHHLELPEFERIFLQFDANNDKNITKPEFLNGWHHFEYEDDKRAPFDFLEMDRNFDGIITADPDLTLLFKFFDDGGNGKISLNEYKSNWEALFEA